MALYGFQLSHTPRRYLPPRELISLFISFIHTTTTYRCFCGHPLVLGMTISLAR